MNKSIHNMVAWPIMICLIFLGIYLGNILINNKIDQEKAKAYNLGIENGITQQAAKISLIHPHSFTIDGQRYVAIVTNSEIEIMAGPLLTGEEGVAMSWICPNCQAFNYIKGACGCCGYSGPSPITTTSTGTKPIDPEAPE